MTSTRSQIRFPVSALVFGFGSALRTLSFAVIALAGIASADAALAQQPDVAVPDGLRTAITMQHLDTTAAAALVTQRGGFAQVAEVRIGGIAHWEVGLRPELAAYGVTSAHFDRWISGASVPFSLSWDDFGRYTLVVGTGADTVVVQSPVGDALAPPRELFLVARSDTSTASAAVHDLVLNGFPLPDHLLVGQGTPVLQEVLRLFNPDLTHGAELSGKLRFAWSATRPRGTALQLQIWAVDLFVPPASIAVYTASDSLIALGLPEARLAFELPVSLRALAADDQANRLWALAGTTLERRRPDGTVELRVNTGLPIAGKARLLSHQVDGSVWVGADKRAESYSEAGAFLAAIDLHAALLDLALSPDDSLLWVSTAVSATAYDAFSGDVVRELEVPLGTSVGCLAVDPNNGGVWVSFADELRHYSEEGELEASRQMPCAVALAPDGQHGAWMGVEDRLEHVDNELATNLVLNPWKAAKEQVVRLTLLPDERTLIVSGNSLTVHMTLSGTILSQTAFYPPLTSPVWVALPVVAP